MTKIQSLLDLLKRATDFFGPCWCNRSIDYKCPQCEWWDEYNKMLENKEINP